MEVVMPSDTAVVLLHAFPLSPDMWEPQRHVLESRFTLCPAFPGFGGAVPGEPSLDGFARFVLGDMDAAGVDRAVVVGLSMGGYVAFRLLAVAPERVAGLVLADTRAGADDEAGRARRTEQATRVRDEGVSWLGDALVPALLGETTRRERPAVEAHVRAMIGAAAPEGVARALEAMRDRPDSTGLLPGIGVPTVVVVGEEDTLTPPSEAQAIANAVPGARLVVLAGAGHLSSMEAPDTFNRVLVESVV
jgi:3-oxoadipate enol-lactonase